MLVNYEAAFWVWCHYSGLTCFGSVVWRLKLAYHATMQQRIRVKSME